MSRRPDGRAVLDAARRATLATLAPDGRPRLVPVCYAVGGSDEVPELWIPLDAKPKGVVDPRDLARVRDIERDPRVSVLVDRWSEDWAELAWVRVDGSASLVPAGGVPSGIVSALLRRYPQYASHGLEGRPAIRVLVERIVTWDGGARTGGTHPTEA